jgi:peptidoglycan/LPS O-acetylase OafA/YrhL
MKSSEGVHFVGLDQVRALAVFIVVSYHFLMASNGGVHSGSASFIGNAIFAEGNTGVGMFMTLSGYLLVRLARDREVDFRAFMFNRALRLAPLLILVLALCLIRFVGRHPDQLLFGVAQIMAGVIIPIWPNGAWSITTEFHFYFLFPAMLLLMRRHPLLLLLIPAAAIALRSGIFLVWNGQHVQDAAYWTIIGRIDEFALGMLFAHYSAWFAKRHVVGFVVGVAWLCIWYVFAQTGGLYGLNHKWIWIGLTSVEGLFYAMLIAYFDRSFAMPSTGLSGAIAKVGEWSFGIYLIHFFFVDASAEWIEAHVVKLDNFYLALLVAIPVFTVAVFIARLSYRCIELPFLRFRTSYFLPSRVALPGQQEFYGVRRLQLEN